MRHKVLIVGVILLVCVVSISCYYLSIPEATYVIEDIPAQIICYGGGC